MNEVARRIESSYNSDDNKIQINIGNSGIKLLEKRKKHYISWCGGNHIKEVSYSERWDVWYGKTLDDV